MDRFFGVGSTSSWKSEPLDRGTYSILSTCLITLGLCVWTAVHLNLPAQGERWAQIWRKLGWTIIGLLAPELVAFTAFQQHSTAKHLSRAVTSPPSRRQKATERLGIYDVKWWLKRVLSRKNTKGKGPDVERAEGDFTPGQGDRTHEWTIIHSHFAAMGGFAIQVPDEYVDVLPKLASGIGHTTRLTLTPYALLMLEEGRPGFLQGLNLPQSSIEDKSKGNIFAKSLACLQAGWFCIQCLGRLTQGLAISFLELNTFGHALCTLFIYFLWWDKPLDIGEPELIRIGPEHHSVVHTLLAHMCAVAGIERVRELAPPSIRWSSARAQRSRIGVECTCSIYLDWDSGVGRLRYNPRDSLRDRIWSLIWGFRALFRRRSVHMKLKLRVKVPRVAQQLETSGGLTFDSPHLRDLPSEGITIQLNEAYEGLYESDRIRIHVEPERIPAKFRATNPDTQRETHVHIEHGELLRWVFLSHTLNDEIVAKNALRRRIQNFPQFTGRLDIEWPVYAVMCLAGLIYGGLHCLAWNAPFQSNSERILWRLSSTTVASTGVLTALGLSWKTSRHLFEEFRESLPSAMEIVTQLPLKAAFTTLRIRANHPLLEAALAGISLAIYWITSPLSVILSPIFAIVIWTARIAVNLAFPVLLVIYSVARVYLVVECFLNLAHLSNEVYQLPRWSQYIPHLG